MNPTIDWNDVIKKEVRGINDEDLGEVQQVEDNYVLVQRGIINKEKFYIPKDQAESYDGDVLKFKFSEQELSQYQDEPPSTRDVKSNSDITQENIQEEEKTDEESVPLTEERLDVSKVSQENQATITKKPVTETKTEQVQLMHEEISIERRPPKWPNRSTKPNTITRRYKNTVKERRSRSNKKTLC